jgi:hypothetical protein
VIPALKNKQALDAQAAIRTASRAITVLEVPPRDIVARVRMLSAAELANCAELYVCRVTVALDQFPDTPPRKGLVFKIDGVARGIVEVLNSWYGPHQVGWVLGVK